jgi:hypothetical protein
METFGGSKVSAIITVSSPVFVGVDVLRGYFEVERLVFS